MLSDCTGVILVGGENKRLPGKKKGFHTLGGITMIEGILSVFSDLFEEIILVARDPKDFTGLDVMVVTDIIPAQCSLAGLHAGLFYASNPWAYVTAWDFPFPNRAVIEHLMKQTKSGAQVIVPRTYDGLEPLSAMYARTCIPLIEAALEKKIYKIKGFYNKKRVREIGPEQLEKLDPEFKFKFNVNTPEDLARAKEMAEGGI